jgi:hypothetical protein
MNEVVTQACLRMITTLDKKYRPERIMVELDVPLLGDQHILGVDIARTWVVDRIVESPSSDVGFDG